MKRILAVLASLLLMAGPALAARNNCSGTTAASAKYAFQTSGTNGVVIVNNSANLMCISFDGPAATGGTNCASGSFPLNPGTATAIGGSYASPLNQGPAAISIISAGGAGDIYSCERW
jgi:hypothetical protein